MWTSVTSATIISKRFAKWLLSAIWSRSLRMKTCCRECPASPKNTQSLLLRGRQLIIWGVGHYFPRTIIFFWEGALHNFSFWGGCFAQFFFFHGVLGTVFLFWEGTLYNFSFLGRCFVQFFFSGRVLHDFFLTNLHCTIFFLLGRHFCTICSTKKWNSNLICLLLRLPHV